MRKSLEGNRDWIPGYLFPLLPEAFYFASLWDNHSLKRKRVLSGWGQQVGPDHWCGRTDCVPMTRRPSLAAQDSQSCVVLTRLSTSCCGSLGETFQTGCSRALCVLCVGWENGPHKSSPPGLIRPLYMRWVPLLSRPPPLPENPKSWCS